MTVPNLIEVIGPSLHHFNTLAPELRCMNIGPTYVVFFRMGQLSLDCIWIPARAGAWKSSSRALRATGNNRSPPQTSACTNPTSSGSIV
jgi:hypothetical protein